MFEAASVARRNYRPLDKQELWSSSRKLKATGSSFSLGLLSSRPLPVHSMSITLIASGDLCLTMKLCFSVLLKSRCLSPTRRKTLSAPCSKEMHFSKQAAHGKEISARLVEDL